MTLIDDRVDGLAMGHFPVCVPSNGNAAPCMWQGVGGASVEFGRTHGSETVEEKLNSA